MENLKQHLISRGMNPDLYRTSYDEENRVVSWFLYNFSGVLVGYQQYRPDVTDKKIRNNPKDARYFTYLKHNDGVFGLDVLNPDDRNIYVVEGVFKAGVLHRLGFNSIAVLSSTPKQLKSWFYVLRKTWNLIAIGDNDKAGQSLVNTVGKGFCSPIDLDEMSDSDIFSCLQEYGNGV